MRTLGLVLAGGQSTRMGRNKAMLSLGGVSLLHRQVDVLRTVCSAESVVVSGHYPGFPCVVDQEPGLGPLEGLRSVLMEFLPTYSFLRLLIVPVDMPALTAKVLQPLLDSDSTVTGVRYTGFYLPVALYCDQSILSILMTLKQTGSGDSFYSLFQKLKIKELPAMASHYYLNMNTPADWESYFHHECTN